MTVKTAHMRLCHSRMVFCFGYPRETQEMVFDAHQRGFAFFRRILWPRYLRQHEDRSEQSSTRQATRTQFPLRADVHSLPGGPHAVYACCWLGKKDRWEKSSPSGTYSFFIRQMAFSGALRSTTPGCWSELLVWAKTQAHPEITDKTIWEVFLQERENLIKPAAPFDGYRIQECRVSSTCLVRF